MLYKNINGRLGNQMFQYAALRAYTLKYGEEKICLNLTRVYKENFKNDLLDFNVASYEEVEQINLSKVQKLLIKVINKIEFLYAKKYKDNRLKYNNKIHKIEKRYSPILMKFGIYWLQQGYVEFKKSKRKTKYFNGLFESSKYFNEYRDVILDEFTPKKEKLAKNKKLYDAINKTNSICVTIRRGDFLSNQFKKDHYVCTPEYFTKAIEKISELVDNPTFFIFSDDIDWVKGNMSFPGKVYYEDGTDPVWEKLRLMYSCKHFIISNSTFSWWAQYLSRNDKKIVIAPSRWKNTYQNDDIYEDNWILIEP